MIASTECKLTDWRCSHCGRLLARIDVENGRVEIVCPKCRPKRVQVLDARERARE